MICPKCNTVVNDNDRFCEECGASLKQSIHQPDKCCCGNYEHINKFESVIQDNKLAVVSNIGRRHPTNEDAGTVFRCENNSSILVVADGVSSSLNATSASKEAVKIIQEVLASQTSKETNAVEMMSMAIETANDAIIAMPSTVKSDGIYGPETTVMAALVQDETLTVGWVGDSRAYLIDKETQELLTIDDSWVETVVKSGELSREQAMLDRRAHYVTQVLGMRDQSMETHIIQHKIQKNKTLLLCSDGLWNYFQEPNSLLYALHECPAEADAFTICEHLINLANNKGGHDNITVAILLG